MASYRYRRHGGAVDRIRDKITEIQEEKEVGHVVQAVIFDQDGLMFDTESLVAQAWKEIGPKYGIFADSEFMRELRGRKPEQIRECHLKRFGAEVMEHYDEFLVEKRRYSYEWIDRNGVPVKKGLKELLSYLKSHGIKTAVATASSKTWTERNVRGAGVEGLFDQYIYGDMVKEAKPDPAIFLLAADRLGVEPAKCVVLEDSFNGIRAAAAGGFLPVMIPDQDEPDEKIRGLLTACRPSLDQVIPLFEDGTFLL